MRATNSIKNIIVATIMNIVTILFGFISQKIFVISLGNEYLGLNGLFNNILSVLAVVELGFGNAIIFHLYKPVSENNREKIAVLVNYYKKVYRIIALLIFALGILITPFISYIVGEVSIQESVYILFFLALLDVTFSYLLTYKRSILYADQKNYIVNIVHIGYTIFLNIFEIILLLLTKNYIVYLLVKIFFRLMENIIISLIVNKMYPYINKKSKDGLDDCIKNNIKQKVHGLLFHKIGSALVLGTDNIIISKVLGVVVVGLYSNYSMIINAVNNLFYQVFTSIVSSVGNLLIENDKDKSYSIYRNMELANSWIYCFTGTCILCLIQPFIEVWMGKDYLLSTTVVIILVINYYMSGMRRTCNTFKEAAGIFYEDRYVPLIEVAVNIIASIILANIFGLAGVFIGTILSSFVLFFYSYPIFVYKKLFGRSYFQFLKEFAFYFVISIVCMFITFLVVNLINISNLLITLFINLIICIIIPNFIYYLIFKNTKEYRYYIELLKKLINKRKACKN